MIRSFGSSIVRLSAFGIPFVRMLRSFGLPALALSSAQLVRLVGSDKLLDFNRGWQQTTTANDWCFVSDEDAAL